MTRVLIFTEASTKIGLGHYTRCSALYEEVISKGLEAELILNADFDLFNIVQNQNTSIINWYDVEKLKRILTDKDICIVDSYVATAEVYDFIAEKSISTLFIDDYNRIDYPKGFILQPSIESQFADDNYLQGLNYTILRKEFQNIKQKSIRHEISKVLVILGGTDPMNKTISIMDYLCTNYPNINFDVVTNTESTCNYLYDQSYKNLKIHSNLTASDMRRLMVEADFSISAAGQTLFELIATQTPFIPIKVVENQNVNLHLLKKKGLIENYLTINDSYFFDALSNEMLKLMDVTFLNLEISKLSNKVDGNGSKRIIDRLLLSV